MSDPVRPKRQPSVLLIVSLCLNLALIGLIAITMMRTGMRHFEPHEGKRGLSAQMLMRRIPAEEDKIRSILQSHRQKLHELRRAAMKARVDAFEMLQAKDFKADAFAKSLQAVQAADAALEAESTKITAESISALTPDERAAIIAETKRPDRAQLRRLFRKH
ncbi:MAG TPA: periplasmic heavy metal sensor [Rhizomicrobium sp.]|nr:periplasmic heavy metal sensor [Rhizomicrobium sp.]